MNDISPRMSFLYVHLKFRSAADARQAGQRPRLHGLRHRQRPHEIAKVVGQRVQLEADGVVANVRYATGVSVSMSNAFAPKPAFGRRHPSAQSRGRRGAGARSPRSSLASTVAGISTTPPPRSITNCSRSPATSLRWSRIAFGIVICPLLVTVAVGIRYYLLTFANCI